MNYKLPMPAMSKQINAFTEKIMDVAWFSAEQMQEAYQAGVNSKRYDAESVEFSQFLSDVTTAAGLLEHGKQSKGLAKRIADYTFNVLRTIGSYQAKEQSEPTAYMVYAKGSRKYYTLTFDVVKVPEIYIGGEVVPLYNASRPQPINQELLDTLKELAANVQSHVDRKTVIDSFTPQRAYDVIERVEIMAANKKAGVL